MAGGERDPLWLGRGLLGLFVLGRSNNMGLVISSSDDSSSDWSGVFWRWGLGSFDLLLMAWGPPLVWDFLLRPGPG